MMERKKEMKIFLLKNLEIDHFLEGQAPRASLADR